TTFPSEATNLRLISAPPGSPGATSSTGFLSQVLYCVSTKLEIDAPRELSWVVKSGVWTVLVTFGADALWKTVDLWAVSTVAGPGAAACAAAAGGGTVTCVVSAVAGFEGGGSLASCWFM